MNSWSRFSLLLTPTSWSTDAGSNSVSFRALSGSAMNGQKLQTKRISTSIRECPDRENSAARILSGLDESNTLPLILEIESRPAGLEALFLFDRVDRRQWLR